MSLESGQLFADPHVENGGTLRLNEDNQIVGPFGRANQLPKLEVDADGLIDLNGAFQSVSALTLNGGQVTVGGTGLLTLGLTHGGDVTTTSSATAARIDGRVFISGDGNFSVANGSA